MTRISDVNPRVATFTACFIGFVLIGDLNVNEQNSVGNLLELIGQLLLANAAQQAVIEDRINSIRKGINSEEAKCMYDPLFYDIDKIRDVIKNINGSNENDLDAISKSLDIMKNEIEKLKKMKN